MPWACLLAQGPVVPQAGGLLCLVPRQGAAIPGPRSLGTSAGLGWRGLRDLPRFSVRRWDMWTVGKGGKPGEEKPLQSYPFTLFALA